LGTDSGDDQHGQKQTPDSADESDALQRYQVVAAAKAIKIEIKDPKDFFDKVTISSDEAKDWLSSRLSAGEKLALLSREKSRPRPQIWMLTGIILMTHATWTSLSSDDQSFAVGLPAPFDPTGVSKIRRLSVSDGVRPTFGLESNDEVKHVSGAVIHETGKYPGTRAWAAQWQRVDSQILSADKGQDGVRNQVRLHRTSGTSPKVAAVKLKEGSYAERGQNVDALDDEYWEAFLDASET